MLVPFCNRKRTGRHQRRVSVKKNEKETAYDSMAFIIHNHVCIRFENIFITTLYTRREELTLQNSTFSGLYYIIIHNSFGGRDIIARAHVTSRVKDNIECYYMYLEYNIMSKLTYLSVVRACVTFT